MLLLLLILLLLLLLLLLYDRTVQAQELQLRALQW